MAIMVLDAIKGGANTQAGIAAYVSAKWPEITPQPAYKRASLALTKLKRKGLERREGRVWVSV